MFKLANHMDLSMHDRGFHVIIHDFLMIYFVDMEEVMYTAITNRLNSRR